ncbi:MAG: TonB-dependent receptor [Bacteroides graminisolvens]
MNYNYAERYLFEANVRYDGSSRVAPEYRWQAFPHFQQHGVLVKKMFHLPSVNNMKVRASWGQLENGAILGLYDYIPMINSGTQLGEKYYFQSQLASKDKKWEIISTTNLGIDLGMFNNTLSVTADYYWKYNDNMLASLQVPSLIGVTVPNANVGKLKTWGWEFEIGYKNRLGNLNYQVSFNLSDSQNR